MSDGRVGDSLINGGLLIDNKSLGLNRLNILRLIDGGRLELRLEGSFGLGGGLGIELNSGDGSDKGNKSKKRNKSKKDSYNNENGRPRRG